MPLSKKEFTALLAGTFNRTIVELKLHFIPGNYRFPVWRLPSRLYT